MKKIVLHCGLHKTGTTALQDFLFDRTAELERLGFLVATENFGNDYKFRNLGSWIDITQLNSTSGRPRDGLYPMLADLAQEGKTVLLSSEAFSWLLTKDEVQKLASDLSEIFDEIKIVFYLRRQDQLALSHFAQRAKNYAVEGTFYGTQNRSPLPVLDANARKYLDHNARLSNFITAFGKGALRVRVYDDKQLVGGNTVSDFQALLGTEIDHPSPVVNRTFGFEKTKFHGDLIDQGLAVRGSLLHRIGQNIIPTRPLTVDRRSAVQFYQAFHEGNLALNRNLQITPVENIFGLDFSALPIKEAYDWRQEDSECLLNSIQRTTEELERAGRDSDRETALLVKAAAFYRRLDPRIAKGLLNLGCLLAPDHPNLTRKTGPTGEKPA